MNLYMAGIDFAHAPLEMRERVSFVRGQVRELLPRIRAGAGVCGCVLLATCNRTELYVHTEGAGADPLALLCEAAGTDAAAYRPYCVPRAGEEAARHLLAVAAGLESQIFGDGQIITQVREALALAREAGTADAVLDTLFRRAVTAGKRVKTEVRLTAVPASAAARAVRRAEEFFGSLAGRRAVVIGNGEMGRTAASLLQRAGCAVTVTLRTYRHGETIVPAGCRAHDYDDRFAILDGADLAVSATTSPHFTVPAAERGALARPPRLLIDLAMPRDIEPAQDERTTLWNLDDLGGPGGENAAACEAAVRILREEEREFYAWYGYRQSLPVIAEIKDAALNRLRYDHAFGGLYAENDVDGLLELAVNKTVDLLLGGMKGTVAPAVLSDCLTQIKRGSGR
ncbi:MAG: glutamyl-tRNA reductase [Eubacteriales bacterium]|nr:glutamyl-tRNA reductase [Eubacteriales bacterium]